MPSSKPISLHPEALPHSPPSIGLVVRLHKVVGHWQWLLIIFSILNLASPIRGKLEALTGATRKQAPPSFTFLYSSVRDGTPPRPFRLRLEGGIYAQVEIWGVAGRGGRGYWEAN